MKKAPYQILSGWGVGLSICGIMFVILGFIGMDFDYSYLYSKSELEKYFIEVKRAVESAGLTIALIGCFICLLCSLILKAIGLLIGQTNSADDIFLQQCAGCNRNFNKDLLVRINSGQLLCPECANSLKNKK
jgi:Na+-driven multidrug efflux pump